MQSDGGDVSALFGADDVAHAADLEVAHGDLEAGAEFGGGEDGVETGVGLLGE